MVKVVRNAKRPSQKPIFRVARNNLGTFVIILLAVLFDVGLVFYSCYHLGGRGGFSSHIEPKEQLELFVFSISWAAATLSALFSSAILFFSSLTVQKRKRLKIVPFLMLLLPKVLILLWRDNYFFFLFFIVKDTFLYIAMSHTSKNWTVRKFFKPYKQVVSYEDASGDK